MNPRHSHPFSAFILCWLVVGLLSVIEVRGQELKIPAFTSKAPILDTVIRSWPVDPAMTGAQERALWEALSQPYTPIAIEIPLDRWVDSVASICPMDIDRTALEGIGLTTNTPINFRLDPPPRSLLVHLLSALEDLELSVEIRHGIVRITTQDMADSRLPVRIYDISPLLGEHEGREKLAAASVLVSAIQNVIDPDGWEVLGGTSVITCFPVKSTLQLCVATRTQTHWQLLVFLDQLQRAGGAPQTAKSSIPRRSSSVPKNLSLEPRIAPELHAPASRVETELPRFQPQGESTSAGGMFSIDEM